MRLVQELHNSVVIVAAGSGSRIDDTVKKQFMPIGGAPMLVRSVRAFADCDFIDEIIIVVGAEDVDYCAEEMVGKFKLSKVSAIVAGGDVRQDSVRKGLDKVVADADIVLIHDCARPFVTADVIEKCIVAAWEFGAAIPAVRVKDTVKRVSVDGFVDETVDREFLWGAQTPQAFKKSVIMSAHANSDVSYERGSLAAASDDAYLVEKMGSEVKIVESSYDNFKITTPSDLMYADFLINDSEDK